MADASAVRARIEKATKPLATPKEVSEAILALLQYGPNRVENGVYIIGRLYMMVQRNEDSREWLLRALEEGQKPEEALRYLGMLSSTVDPNRSIKLLKRANPRTKRDSDATATLKKQR